MIVHLVQFNRQHHSKPPSFALPVVEVLAILVKLHHLRAHIDCFRFPEEERQYLRDPFLDALHELSVSAKPGEPLFACHVDFNNAFWCLSLLDKSKSL